MTRALLLATLSFSLVACVGGIETGPGPGPGPGSDTGSGSDIGPPLGNTGSGGDMDGGGSATARDFFNANVYPAILGSCGSSSCHSLTSPGAGAPAFVNQIAPTQDDSAAWDTITGLSTVIASFQATAPLLSVPQNTAHFAKFTPTQVTSITNWLSLEATWRAADTGSGGGSGTTSVDLMAQFSGCMQYSDFQAANVAQAFAKQVDTNQGYCENCHVNGQANSYMIATPDSANMFAAMSTYREYLSTYFTIDTTTNAVVVNTIPFKLAAEGGINGEHPVKWDPTNNKGMTALATFFTATAAHMTGTAPACGAPTLSD